MIRECLECKDMFDVLRKDQKFCCRKCCDKFRNRARREAPGYKERDREEKQQHYLFDREDSDWRARRRKYYQYYYLLHRSKQMARMKKKLRKNEKHTVRMALFHKRKEIIKACGGKCVECGAEKNLEIHSDGGRIKKYEHAVVLCRDCNRRRYRKL